MAKLYYPVGLDLDGKDVLLVGGGTIAEGKVAMLLECGARVTVVSPEVKPSMAEAAAAKRLMWHRREFEASDVDGAWIVIAATDDRAVNARVAEVTRAAGRLVNAVDDVPNCDFIATAVVRRGDLQLSISTGGGSPAMARWVREEMEAIIPEEFGPLLDVLADVRAELKAAGKIPPYAVWSRAITPRVLELLADERRDEARRLLFDALTGRAARDHWHREEAPSPAHPGVVYLVGAGPGAPDLITVRGKALVESADVVVYDRLVRSELLDLAAPGAELVDVGKEPGKASPTQEAINRLLVERARHGRSVVRLKGGDPFVFGRGGEEVEALAAAGVPCEVVPGVTSAVAGPASIGIPVTHRGLSTAVAFVTGHDASDDGPAWDELARSGATLVVLMGMENLPAIVRRLVDAGRSLDEPVAVVSRATWPEQRSVRGTLDDVVARTRAAGLNSPAVVVVGAVAALGAEATRSALLEVATR